MAQAISLDLQGYLVCCADGKRVIFEQDPPLPKYLFLGSLPSATTRNQMMQQYLTPFFSSNIIEIVFGVGTPGMAQIEISYVQGTDTVVTIDRIFVDTTSSSSFWTDINGWMQMNNFHEISYDLADKWLINDSANLTYIKIIKI